MRARPEVTAERPAVLGAAGRDGLVARGRVVKNTVSQLVAFGLNAGTKAIVALIVAHTSGPEGLGTFFVAWTIAQATSVLCVAGLDYLLIREVARRREPSELERAFPLAALLGLAAAGLVAGGGWLWTGRPDLSASLLAGAVYVALSAPALVFRAAFHARERMELDAAASAVEGVVAIAAAATIVALGGGVPGAVAGLAVGRAACGLAGLTLYARLWGRPRPRWEPRSWPRLLRASGPMGISHVFTALYLRFDIVLLGVFLAAREVGVYSAAAVIILTVPVVATSFNGSLYPILCRIGDPGDAGFLRAFRSSARLQVLLGLPMAAGLSVLARPLVALLYGDGFGSSAALLAVLAWVLPLRFLNNLLGVALTATDRQGLRTAAVTAGALMNLLLNLALIPWLGYWGAVWATLATEVVLSGGLLWALRPLRPPVGQPLALGLLSAALTVGIVGAMPGPVLLRVAFGGIVTLGLAAVGMREPTSDPDEVRHPVVPVVDRSGPAPGITAVVLTRNETHNLERCVRTLRWVDRVLVVDAQSDDGTPGLARRLGCDVVVHPQRDFASQRNFALSLVRTEWVLWVDADWEVGAAFAEAARVAIRDPRYVAYEFPMVNVFCGHPLRRSVKIRCRLHRADRARWEHPVHEQLAVDGPVGEMREPVVHHYVEHLPARVAKIVHYAEIDAARRLESGYRFRRRDLLVAPLRRSLGNLILRRGLLDGVPGVVLWTLRGLETFLALAFVWAAQRSAGPAAVVGLDAAASLETSPASEWSA